MSENNNLVENSNPNLTSQSFGTANDSSSLVDSNISTFLIENKEIKLDLIEKVEPACSSNCKNDTNTENNVQSPSRKSSTFSSKSKFDKKSIQKYQNETANGLGSIADSCTVASITGVALTNPSINNSNIKLRTKNVFDTTSLDSSSSAGSLYSSLNHITNGNNTNNASNSNNNNNTNNTNNDNNATSGNIYSSNLNSIQQTPINLLVKDPIIIRGGGNITIFGVSNRFNEQFPSQLNAKLAPEEFRDTIKQINNILSKELSNSFKWLVFGSIFCCCTLGCSLLPVIFMNKKAKLSVNKLLEMENQRLYLKLGLKWKLTKIKYNSNSLLEYVLLIEFLPTILLYQPD
jgi:hypothetical protein